MICFLNFQFLRSLFESFFFPIFHLSSSPCIPFTSPLCSSLLHNFPFLSSFLHNLLPLPSPFSFFLPFLFTLLSPFSHRSLTHPLITFPPLSAPSQFKPASSLTSLTDRVTYIATKKIREKKKNQPESFQVILPYTANSKDTGTGNCTGTVDGHSTVNLDVVCMPFETGNNSNLNDHLILLLCCLLTVSTCVVISVYVYRLTLFIVDIFALLTVLIIMLVLISTSIILLQFFFLFTFLLVLLPFSLLPLTCILNYILLQRISSLHPYPHYFSHFHFHFF